MNNIFRRDHQTKISALHLWLIIYTIKNFQAGPRRQQCPWNHVFMAWLSNKKFCSALSLTGNIHWIIFQIRPENKNYFNVKTICDKACFPAKPSNKSIYCVIFVIGSAANSGWSTVNYRQTSIFDRIYLSCNDHCDCWLLQEIFFTIIIISYKLFC